MILSTRTNAAYVELANAIPEWQGMLPNSSDLHITFSYLNHYWFKHDDIIYLF